MNGTVPALRTIIAPTYRVGQLFMQFSGYRPSECRIVTREEQLQGTVLNDREVWFLQGMWPCRTHEDVRRMEDMMAYARFRGADIRRWWT